MHEWIDSNWFAVDNRLIRSFCSISENPKSNQPATWHQRRSDLCKNGFSNGCHMDSWNCCKLENFVIPLVPVCGFKQPSRHVSVCERGKFKISFNFFP